MKNPHESGLEQIPTKEEVLGTMTSLFGKLFNNQEDSGLIEDKITVEKNDEVGILRVLEVTRSGENGEEKIELVYIKGGEPFEGYSRMSSGIDSVLYDAGGVPCGGTNVAEYVNGVWIENI
jgi:hypothetical protein